MLFNRLVRLTNRVLPAATFILLIAVSSCKKRDTPDPDLAGEVTNAEINRWIVDTMRYYYYWNTSIPQDRNLNFDLGPEEFFETLLNRPTDRFSWIQNAKDLKDESAGIIKTSGLSPSFILNENNRVVMVVRYVHKGSPADLKGIKRGDMFLGINGESWRLSGNSIANADALFGNEPFTLEKAKLVDDDLEPDGSVSLTPVEGFRENAILLDSILETPNGTKVAYLFYNRFLFDQQQAQQLVDVFEKFKDAGVSELIVDERYNPGGYVVAASLLSALIHPNFDINSPYIQYDYNENFVDATDTYGDLFGRENADLVSQRNLGLNRVFILATGSSASASELLINNLKPFLGANVIHIGGKTVGKDEFSIMWESSSPRLKANDETDWGIQPIVGKYKNANGEGDFERGLIPQYAANEANYPYAPMGSAQDRLIAAALGIIDPTIANQLKLEMGVHAQKKRVARELTGFNDPAVRPRPVQSIPLQDRKPIDLR